MAYTAGNKLYTVSFKSLNGTSCLINIYKRGYTGDMVFNLTGADNPFFFEEDEDEDILNNVLRYRTGYIRIMRDNNIEFIINDIFPSEVYDRYVEVYYGESLVFTGYIQVQNFSNELIPNPKVLELPVISQLGLMENKKFSNTTYLPPRPITLADAMNNVIGATTYEYLYLPKKYGYPNEISLGMKMMSLVISPWNDEYHHSMNDYAMYLVMKGKSHAYFVEALCKAFGWIAHETGNALVFTAFDYEDEYCYYPTGHIGESGYRQDANIPASAITLTDYFEPADSEATETTLQPDTGIEINYEGDSETGEFNFKHTYVPAENGVIIQPSFIPDMQNYPAHAEIFSLCNLVPVPLTGEFSSTFAPLTFNSNDKINIGHNCVAWNGKEGIMVSMASYNTGQELFWIRFYIKKNSNQRYGLSYDVIGRRDGEIGGLNANPDIDAFYIYTSIDVSHTDYIQVSFRYRYGANYPQLPNNALIFISNIKLDIFQDEEPYSEYRYKPTSDSDIIPDSTQTVVSNSVDMPISMYRLNNNLIGNSVRATKITEYPYLFTPRKELVGIFKYSAEATFPHIRLYNYLSKKWRIIAQRFDPWNDEYQLTMQNSSVL